MSPPAGVVVFDLDDTLYLERAYVLSGLAAVGRWIAERRGVEGFAGVAAALFEGGRRGDIFDAALAALGQPATPEFIASLVRVYRRHRPDITLAPDAARWLDRVPSGWAVALISDGPAASQSRKVAALRLVERGIEPIILTDRWGTAFRKPHPRGFRRVQRVYGLAARACIYVGDNAAKDFLGPRRLGWASVQVCRPGGLHALPAPTPDHLPDLVTRDLSALTPECLESLAAAGR